MDKKANIVLTGATFFNGKYCNNDVDFVAVKGNKVLCTGKEKDMESVIDADTKVVKLPKSSLVMPGFHDSHSHILTSALYGKYVHLESAKSEEETVKMVYDHVTEFPESGWVIGYSWYHVFWDKKVLPTKESLDRYFPDKPVCLFNSEGHDIWVNSKALEIAGITKDTEDPPYGTIKRDEHGEPTGILSEMAVGLITRYAYSFTLREESQLALAYLKNARKNGITSANDLLPGFGHDIGQYDTYHALDINEMLTTRVHAAPDLTTDLDYFEESRKKYNSEKYQLCMLKAFIDGVCTTYTALLLDDYSDMPGYKGTTIRNLDEMMIQVENAHKRGIPVRIHCCGDGSVYEALNMFENAYEKFGNLDVRHGIEHVELVLESDFERFRKYKIIASMQPEHIALTESLDENVYPIRFGQDRIRYTWPFRTLLENDVPIAIGSDCPVVDNNPFTEIYRGATRLFNDGKPEGGWNPLEIIGVEDLLHSYTYGSAYGVNRENELGTIEEGKYADIVILDKDLLSIDREEIRKTKVLGTIMDGKFVYID